MSTSIAKPLPTGKDPPDKVIKSPTPSLKTTSSIPDQPQETVRAPFTPFFTLINSTHHPTQVHYVFSDDDPEILTSACLSALSPPSPTTSITSPFPSSTSSSSTSATAPTRRPSKTHKQHPSTPKEKPTAHPPPPHREERTIILTLSETGDTIQSAHSLTPTWQILSTEITNAPTWDATDTEGTSHAGGLMLKIEGTDGSTTEETTITQSPVVGRSAESQRRGDLSADTGIDMQALMESFDAKMNMLRKVIEAGGSTLSGEVQAEISQEEVAE